MSTANFSLTDFHFDKINASIPEENNPGDDHHNFKLEISMRIKDPDEEEASGFWANIIVSLETVGDQKDDVKSVIKVVGAGRFQFDKNVDAYKITDPLERAYAVNLLYTSMRPMLNSIGHGLGLSGLNFPFALPSDVAQAHPPQR
ncbi:hypothetical protein [Carnimonas bestiolae]|uniref:hypothetical protein n=1 Tax=Carnimonas bestiolae TaxID=3402172 RepID=UPI003EDBD673